LTKLNDLPGYGATGATFRAPHGTVSS